MMKTSEKIAVINFLISVGNNYRDNIRLGAGAVEAEALADESFHHAKKIAEQFELSYDRITTWTEART